MTNQKEFGDFQTPLTLAEEVITLINELMGVPSRVIEPTAGLGSFLDAAQAQWGSIPTYEGYEINPVYVAQGSAHLSSCGIQLLHQDFFQANWQTILTSARKDENILIVGNPPWITNAALGTIGSCNLPVKSNFQGLRGFDAKTGKSNFDIAEWMLIRLIEALPSSGAIAMLCKTMTARKVLKHFWKTDSGFMNSSLFLIDAKLHFNVSVDACLFFALGKRSSEKTASIHSSLSKSSKISEFGLVDGYLVSDVRSYQKYRDIDGGSPYTWRSGVKHDASEIMELTRFNGHYQNGLGEDVIIEPDCIYPLLKSSDLGNGRVTSRRHVLITQKKTGDQTEVLKEAAPQTWNYLVAHSDRLDGRKSSIYQNRPRYSIFGIGDYSFSTWKVAISGLYKSSYFSVVPPDGDRPVMVDDTCYFIPCGREAEAKLLCDLLNSQPCQEFLSSLVFNDSKRPITTEILRRISLVGVARRLGRLDELSHYVPTSVQGRYKEDMQMSLVMDNKEEYRTNR